MNAFQSPETMLFLEAYVPKSGVLRASLGKFSIIYQWLNTWCGCGCSSGVEHYLAKVRVVSSNLITRSNFQVSRLHVSRLKVSRLLASRLHVSRLHVSKLKRPSLLSPNTAAHKKCNANSASEGLVHIKTALERPSL